jgi:enediyne biosynthesis protein E4
VRLGVSIALIFTFLISNAQDQMYFEIVPADQSGIDFTNSLTETAEFNYLSFQYMYNGGGVAIGDINNDGLADIYFTGNQVEDKLYLNKGDMKFEDISKTALDNQIDKGWHTGVTMADVNQDGYLDIYVSRSGLESDGELLSNLLYINQKDNSFKEESKTYGIAGNRASNQAAFFDMDNDGDLDLYIMNRPTPPAERKADVDLESFPYSDQLFENVKGKFHDISKEAGIQNYGFGLGISVADFNNDGFQDLYISNDYIGQDYMYINQKDKSFKEEIKSRTGHVAYNGMGVDVADFNNDGFMDIMTVDMAIEDHVKSKKSMGAMAPEEFWKSVEFGNQYEYMFNTLQLANGNGTFSDIALMAGVAKTDWSWGPLFADFDNDGLKDIVITNGFRREVRDNDYLLHQKSLTFDNSDFEEILGMAEETKVPNYFFKNMGDLSFKNVTIDWKMQEPINSNGAAYADLDNDGDLDLVINNMEMQSSILENKLKSNNHFLKVKINENFEGARVEVRTTNQAFYQEINPTRGFQSSSSGILHFGLGDITKISQVVIRYPGGQIQVENDVAVDQLLELEYDRKQKEIAMYSIVRPNFRSKKNLLSYKHTEYFMNDFLREILLPNKMSQLGPFMSKGDVDGNGLEDFYISGSRYYPGAMFYQVDTAIFEERSGPWVEQKEREELGSILFDCDNDGDLDLYVVGGSNEYIFYSGNPKEEQYNKNLMDQLYINDGTGQFGNETNRHFVEEFIFSGQRPIAGDYDGDGDLDLFIAGRQIPGFYPFAPRSVLLRNENGRFYNATNTSPDLAMPGMITQSLFDDIDGDGDLDLICVGEWMPITVFENVDGKFKNVTEKYGLTNTVGWWTSIAAGDFNSDGINDYVLGNVGENNKFHPSEEQPLEIYALDFDQSGTFDIVLGNYQNGTCFPVRGRECSSQQMPFITNKFPTYDEFANANLESIYGSTLLDSALHYSATEFKSSVLLSNASGFELQALPKLAQLGPMNAFIVNDFNNDGYMDVLGVGNNYGAEIETVRYDSNRGVLLIGDGTGQFVDQHPWESGFFVNSDAKDMLMIDNFIIVSSNNDSLKVFEVLR